MTFSLLSMLCLLKLPNHLVLKHPNQYFGLLLTSTMLLVGSEFKSTRTNASVTARGIHTAVGAQVIVVGAFVHVYEPKQKSILQGHKVEYATLKYEKNAQTVGKVYPLVTWIRGRFKPTRRCASLLFMESLLNILVFIEIRL